MSNGNIIVSWNDIDEMVENLYQKLKEENIDKVVGISRGGLIPGVMLSHKLNAGFEPLEWQTRDGEFQDRIKANGFNKNLKGTIFVDDICDSALTINQIKEIIPNSRWAVLHQKADISLDFVAERLCRFLITDEPTKEMKQPIIDAFKNQMVIYLKFIKQL